MSNKPTPHTIEIGRTILLALKSARQKYVIFLEEEKKKKASSEAEIQAEHITTDIDKIKTRCKQMQSAVEMMDNEFVVYMKVQKKNDKFCN